MITLNTDRGFVTIETWDDIESRVGFVKSLNPAEHRLADVIGSYQFKQQIPCGLSNCRQLHAKGYIAVTNQGLETNLGKDCGRKHFGIDFVSMMKRHDRQVAEQQYRERLWAFVSKVDAVDARIAELRRLGADQVHKNVRLFQGVNRGCPDVVRRQIADMVEARSNILSLQREATADEIDAIETREGRRVPRPHYIDTRVAEVAGLEALYPENDLRQLLAMDLAANLETFRKLEIATLLHKELKRWTNWCSSVEETLETVQRIIGLGGQFLTLSNLRPFNQLLQKREEQVAFGNFLKVAVARQATTRATFSA